MARLDKEALIRRALGALAKDGWAISRLTADGVHPARFAIESEGVRHTVKLYIWNLSHGGASRSEDEFRIQVTGIEKFEPEPGGRTLILGWSDEFGVAAGFDVQHRLAAPGASSSIQISRPTLEKAASAGASKQSKGGGEWAIAVRPDRLGRYVQHVAAAHSGDLDPLLAGEDSPAADPLASELQYLAEISKGFDPGPVATDELRLSILASNSALLSMLKATDEQSPPPVGHNNPPGPIDEPPPLAGQIEAAGETIRSELQLPTPDVRAVGRAGAFLAWAGKMIAAARREAAKLAEKSADLAREYLAKAMWGGAVGLGMIFKEEMVELLRHLARSILHWMQGIAIF